MNLKNSDKAIEFYNAPIRSDDHFTGLNFEMQTYGFGLGFGQDYYAYDARGVYQNIDAVYSELSDLYSNKKKHEIILVQVWTNLVKSILFLLKETGVLGGEMEDIEIDIKPDDSIIINDEAEYQKDLDRVDRGTLPAWKVEVKWFGLTEEEAKANIAEANTFEEIDTGLTPNDGETEEAFIQRFMSDDEMILEFTDETQRRAIAQETFEKSGS
jgi:A118 family predicted phage portal protein